MYFVDSIRTNESFIKQAYQPSEFAAVTVIKGDNAIKIGGQEGRNGIIYIYTKTYTVRNILLHSSRNRRSIITPLNRLIKAM
jgi:hypothetical protein